MKLHQRIEPVFYSKLDWPNWKNILVKFFLLIHVLHILNESTVAKQTIIFHVQFLNEKTPIKNMKYLYLCSQLGIIH